MDQILGLDYFVNEISVWQKNIKAFDTNCEKICMFFLFIFIKSADKIVYQKRNSFTHQLTVPTAFEERKLDAVHDTILFFGFPVTRSITKIFSMNSLFSGIFFPFCIKEY